MRPQIHDRITIGALLAALVVVTGACGGGGGDSLPSVCGNGTVEAGEDCDDGNDVEGDGCEATCLFSCVADVDCDDGDACTSDTCSPASGCVNAALTTWYEDSDGDGYGNAAAPACAADAPAGFVANATDCCDTSAATFPGQPQSFESANTCGTYDYNCDGVLQLGLVALGICSGASCSALQGFLGTIPYCGQTGTYLVGCSMQSTSCVASDAIAVKQTCR